MFPELTEKAESRTYNRYAYEITGVRKEHGTATKCEEKVGVLKPRKITQPPVKV